MRRVESGRVSVVKRDGIVAGFDLDADVPEQRSAMMLSQAEDIVDTGEDRRKNGFAVRTAFHGSGTVRNDRGNSFLTIRSLLGAQQIHAVDGRHAGGRLEAALGQSRVH